MSTISTWDIYDRIYLVASIVATVSCHASPVSQSNDQSNVDEPHYRLFYTVPRYDRFPDDTSEHNKEIHSRLWFASLRCIIPPLEYSTLSLHCLTSIIARRDKRKKVQHDRGLHTAARSAVDPRPPI